MALMDDVLSVSTCGIKSVEMNALINSKIEGKKLRLNQKKCHKMHIRSKKSKVEECDTNLVAHDKSIEDVNKFSYLGDVLSSEKGYQENVEAREGKAIGIRNQIMSILKSG